jgi:hypothetical protein
MKEGMRSIITCVRVLLEDLLFPFNLFSCTSRDIDVYNGHTPREMSEIVVHEISQDVNTKTISNGYPSITVFVLTSCTTCYTCLSSLQPKP